MSERKHVRLLVVNEQSDYCKHIKEQTELNSHYYDIECQCVPTGREAIKAISKWTPDLVLLDMFLEDMNSMDVLQYCNGIKTPVVATTEEQLEQIKHGALENGAVDYLMADDDPDNIDYMLEKVVELASTSQQTQWC